MRKLCQELGHTTFSVHGDEACLDGVPSKTLNGKPRGLGRVLQACLPKKTRVRWRESLAQKNLDKLLGQNSFDFIWYQNTAGAAKWGWSDAWIQHTLVKHQVVVTLHDMYYLGVGDSYVWERPLVANRFAGMEGLTAARWIGQGRLFINACSSWLGSLCQELYGVSCGQLTVPLWPEDFCSQPRRRTDSKKVTYLMAADFLGDKRKNILPTLECLVGNKILEATNSHILCLGRGTPEKMKHVPGISFLGHLEDPQEYRSLYDRFDYLLHPSLLDNFPLLIQESLAQGRPVLALDRGGVSELVQLGNTGILLKEISVEALLPVFRRLAGLKPDQYAKESQRACTFARTMYSASRCRSQYGKYIKTIQSLSAGAPRL